MDKKEFIQEYLNRGFSLIPLKNNSKRPCIKWKQYQSQRASFKDILNWYSAFSEPNLAIVTGDISNLAVIDLDNSGKYQELLERVPEIEDTARVETKRFCHFYFSGNGIRSTNNLLDIGIELKSNHNYVVSPPSIVEGHQYTFIVPLEKIKPLPNIIIESLREERYEERRVLELPRYHGLGISCVSQILNQKLPVGIRNNALFILYNLLLQNGNATEHSKKIVILKNNSLSKPLINKKEIDNLFKREYNHRCSSIRERLPFIDCDKCKKFRKGLDEMVGSVLIKNIRELPKLTNTERGVLCLLDVYFSGEDVSINRLAEISNMDYRTVQKTMSSLKDKGILK